jgi:carbonic anhydrase
VLLGPTPPHTVDHLDKPTSTVERETSTASTSASSSSSSSIENSPRHATESLKSHVQALEQESHQHVVGMEQSPIDICAMDSELVLQDEDEIEVVLGDAAEVRVVHFGSNFRVDWQQKSEEKLRSCMKIKGKTYYAVQFHFHAPSEHTLSGQHEAMELHLVHQAADGSLAVVAIFFKEGKENEFLAQFWNELPAIPSDGEEEVAATSTKKIDAASLQLLKGKFFRYRGSLTTPPYSEGVEWVIMQDVAEASLAQLEHYRSTIPSPNAREVQPRNHRLVTLRQCACAP